MDGALRKMASGGLDHPMMRALVLAFVALAMCAQAQTHPETASVANIRLWPGTAPGSDGAPEKEFYQIYNDKGSRFFWRISNPMMTAFYAAKPNGAAVLVIPGGGYRAVYFDSGVTIARWFNTIGVDAFVLKYRLPDEGHRAGHSVPLQDAQRGLRLIRSGVLAKAAGHTIESARIGVLGLSAGGNLAAVLATYHDKKVYEPIDDSDAVSARPDFMILGYAVLPSALAPAGDQPLSNVSRLYHAYRPTSKISADTPPAFIFAGDSDHDVPYTDSTNFSQVLKRADVPVELHVFTGAGHGFVLGGKGEERVWPELCAAWLRNRNVIPAATQ